MNARTRKGRGLLWGLFAFLITLAILAACLVYWGLNREPEITYDGQAPTEQEVTQMNPEPTSGRFVVPSVGLDAPMGRISIPASDIINPPDFSHVFIFRGFGKPGDAKSGTVYAATHSLKGSKAPGNSLIDVDSGTPTLHKGDDIRVDGHAYTVESSTAISKEELPRDKEVWDKTIDNRLVLITCLQRPEGRSIDNVVTIAQAAD